MKHKIIALLGRTGSILIVIGLALGLVSTQPPRVVTSTFPSRFYVFPRRYTLIFPPPYIGTPSPRYGFRFSVTFNNSLQFYIIATHPSQLREWVFSWTKEHYPALNESQVYREMFNASVLEAYLQTHPENVLLNQGVKGGWSIDFFPQKATNVTVVFSNPSIMSIDMNMKITGITTPVPRNHALMLIQTLLVSGTVLTLPWAVKKSKDYVRSR